MRLKVGQVGGFAAAAAIALVPVSTRAKAFRSAPETLAVVNRDTGQELPQWHQGGRLFVAGRPGARYSLRVANRTDGRIPAVIFVDGVNVVTGETAGYGQRELSSRASMLARTAADRLWRDPTTTDFDKRFRRRESGCEVRSEALIGELDSSNATSPDETCGRSRVVGLGLA
jgi:hypothetical protein